MKRALLPLFAVLAALLFAAPSFAQYTSGGNDETTEDKGHERLLTMKECQRQIHFESILTVSRATCNLTCGILQDLRQLVQSICISRTLRSACARFQRRHEVF